MITRENLATLNEEVNARLAACNENLGDHGFADAYTEGRRNALEEVARLLQTYTNKEDDR